MNILHFINQFFQTGDNFCVFSGVLQVQLSVLVFKVRVVEAFQCCVLQFSEYFLGVDSRDPRVCVGAAQVSRQPLRPTAVGIFCRKFVREKVF